MTYYKNKKWYKNLFNFKIKMTESEYSNCSECYNYSINNYIYENDKKKCLELNPDEYKKNT